MSDYKTTVLTVSVHQSGDSPVFGERNTFVSVNDEGGGEFIVIKQFGENSNAGEVRLDPEELRIVCDIANEMVRGFPYGMDKP
jgi:hypothetical protein